MANIAVLDDDQDLLSFFKTALERDGHTVCAIHEPEAFTEALARWADCILLDVMIPGTDGVAVCRRIRGLTDAPILFLTAKTGEPDVLAGLGAGGDDYLCKPVRLAELRARVNAHLRRQSRVPSHRVIRGGVTLDLYAGTAAVGETPLQLTRAEYAICEYLVRHAGRTFAREQIYEAVFGLDGEADDTAVTEHVKNIRAKLRRAGLQECPLETVWGVGYKWNV